MTHRLDTYWLLRWGIVIALAGTWFASSGSGGRDTSVVRAAPAFTVNATEDAVDVAPGDGICATAAGTCTLRAAMMEANRDASATSGTPPAPITITVPAGTYRLTRKPQYRSGTLGAYDDGDDRGDLNITGVVTITGAGADATIVDGANEAADLAGSTGDRDRVFRIEGSAIAQIAGVTIQGGQITFGTNSNFGGRGGASGGGISVEKEASLLLTDSVVRDNFANGGGGIANSGTLTVVRSRIIGNSAVSERSNTFNSGGITNGGTLTIVDSTIADNRASRSGGGIAGAVMITGSTISGNKAGSGGGIYGIATITNSTITGNTVPASGGGLWGGGTLTNTTVAFNVGGSGNGIAHYTSFEIGSTDAITLRNTLVFNPGGENCTGAIVSGDYNLSSDASCALRQPHDLPTVEPRLGMLGMNGGPTATVPLLAGSPAIDAGGTGANGCPATDQRGVTRPQGTACDIGAYEREVSSSVSEPPTPPTPPVGPPLTPVPFVPRRLGAG